jgi:hypothetical protein
VLAEVVDLDRVGVPQRRGHARLAFEARARTLASCVLRQDELEGHLAAQLDLRGQKDHAHPALAQLALELEAPRDDVSGLQHRAVRAHKRTS